MNLATATSYGPDDTQDMDLEDYACYQVFGGENHKGEAVLDVIDQDSGDIVGSLSICHHCAEKLKDQSTLNDFLRTFFQQTIEDSIEQLFVAQQIVKALK